MNRLKVSRREFINDSAKTAVTMAVAGTAIQTILTGCSSTKKINVSQFNIGLEQSPLPYSFDALENIIDKATMEIHYGKHAAAYCKALKEAIAEAKLSDTENVENILANISKHTAKMRNNAGGHYNHEMFWKCMRKPQSTNVPTGKLMEAIEKSFTSFAEFKKQFADAGIKQFGSGWAWLYVDSEKKLKIGSTPNQDNPLMNISSIKGFPILGLDVWEHAYYLKYQNKRAEYINKWWDLVNWDYVSQRFKAAMSG